MQYMNRTVRKACVCYCYFEAGVAANKVNEMSISSDSEDSSSRSLQKAVDEEILGGDIFSGGKQKNFEFEFEFSDETS